MFGWIKWRRRGAHAERGGRYGPQVSSVHRPRRKEGLPAESGPTVAGGNILSGALILPAEIVSVQGECRRRGCLTPVTRAEGARRCRRWRQSARGCARPADSRGCRRSRDRRRGTTRSPGTPRCRARSAYNVKLVIKMDTPAGARTVPMPLKAWQTTTGGVITGTTIRTSRNFTGARAARAVTAAS